MLRKKQGFTLIELMVVIVIIGVLASLAIPRFTEASDKAKVAEAPRILVSYESAYLAALAEKGAGQIAGIDDLVFDPQAVNDASKWFVYDFDFTDADAHFGNAVPKANIGKFKQTELITTYDADTDVFQQSADETTATAGIAKRYVPNFFRVEAANP